MQRYFRWRVFLAYLILIVSVVTIVSLATLRIVRQQNEAAWGEHYLKTAQLIASQSQVFYQNQGSTEELSNLALEYVSNLGVSLIFLDMEGNILGSSFASDQQPTAPLDLPVINQARSEGQGIANEDGDITVAVTVQGSNDVSLGVLQLQVSEGNFKLDLTDILWLTLAILIISALALFLLTVIIGQEKLKLIETLTITAEQMSMRNFRNLKFPKHAQELEGISQALQKTSTQLDAQIDSHNSEQAKLSAVLNQMTDGVLIVDDKGKVQLLNPSAERLFQIDPGAGLGRSIVETLRYHQLVDLWRMAKNGQRQSTMLEIGPQHVFLQVVAIPLSKSLQDNTLLLFQDLTQLRRLETVRKDFISNISHELRTPLASLNALVETLMEGALDDPPAAKRFIHLMQTEIYNLTQLVNEILDLSRIESGKMPLSFHRLRPDVLIQPAYERMAVQADRAGLTLTQACPKDLPAVFADPDRITQVLINLIHNAIKFTPAGGEITTSAYLDGEQIVFFVRDTGVGIERKDLGRIFERFYKADQARTSGGTGLGLSIAKHMIESHGGYIWAESVLGEGSTFSFTLPLA
jgi:two-component system phosphate regulon sensor histidine kinase PhoR